MKVFDKTDFVVGCLLGTAVGDALGLMELLGKRLAEVSEQNVRQPALPLPIYGIFVQNLFFLLVVILHGFCLLLPTQ